MKPNTSIERITCATKLLLLLLLLALPAVVQAQFTFITNPDNTLTITGYSGPPWAVNIPTYINGLLVTSIGTSAFENRIFLTSVMIGTNVTSIGSNAFNYCISLTNVTIGTNVTSIGDFAFYYCTSLTNFTIPASVTSIGDGAFYDCTHLTAITVDTNNPAFSSVAGILFNQSQTTLIACPARITYPTCLVYTNPASVTDIGDYAFANCISLCCVTIGNNVTNIGNYAFAYCGNLFSATIGNNVTSIGHYAFAYSGMEYVAIGNSVTSIGDHAFYECTGLVGVYFDGNAPSADSTVFSGDSRLTVYYVPWTTSWGPTFGGCTTALWVQFTYTTNNGTITIMGNTLHNSTGSFPPLTLSIPSTINNLPVTSLGDHALSCPSLTSVTIPDSVTNIGYGAFYDCYSLTSVMIPNSVTSIGDLAFYDCTSLTNFTIPASVTSIGNYAFYYCTSLKGVYFQGNAPTPTNDSTVFLIDGIVTVYYLPGTTGWGSTFDGRPTALWFLPNPLILNNSTSFGVQINGFGFIISWATNVSVVVESCTNLANPVWSPVGTNTLTNGSSYFSDPQWTNYPGRFYRLRSP